MNVPTVVAAGYAIGYGLGEYVERLQRVAGRVEHVILGVALVSTLALIAWRALHTGRDRRGQWPDRAGIARAADCGPDRSPGQR